MRAQMCEVCAQHLGTICAMPGSSLQCWYCDSCLRAHAQPLSFLAAEVWLLGGFLQCPPELVHSIGLTLMHLDIPFLQFQSMIEDYQQSYSAFLLDQGTGSAISL